MGLFSVLATAALFLLAQTSASFYPCPQPPAENEHVMSLREAYSPHLEYPQGWYYLVGGACEVGFGTYGVDCESPFAYQIITYMYNISQTGTNQVIFPGEIAVTDKTGHYSWTGDALSVEFPDPETNPFNLNFQAPNNVSIKFENVGFLPAGTKDSSYLITASTPNATLELYLFSLSSTMWQGNGGYAGSPNSSSCTGYYYVSMPQLLTLGTVTFNGRKFLISGETWLDHEWGGVLVGSNSGSSGPGTSGWVWMGLRFGSTSIMLIILRQNNVYLVGQSSLLDVQYGNGTMAYGKVTSLEVLSTWTSPATNVIFPNNLFVNTTVPGYEHLTISPVFQNQEVGTGKNHYWEGYVTVESDSGTGEGYLELTGYQS
jgi:predicted secreted hydrolase